MKDTPVEGSKAELGSPGSDKAVGYGCTCPVMDNNNGAGFPYNGSTSYYINSGCTIHGDIKETL